MEIEKIENIIVKHVDKIIFISFVLVLLGYVINARHREEMLSEEIRNIHFVRSQQENTLNLSKSFRDMMVENSGLIGTKFPIINDYIYNIKGIKILAVCKSFDDYKTLRCLLRVLNILKKHNENIPVVYMADKYLNSINMIKEKFYQVQGDGLIEFRTPSLFVLGMNNIILLAFSFSGYEDLETINLIINVVSNIVQNNHTLGE